MTSLSSRRPLIRLALNRTEVALSIGVSTSSVDAMVAEGVLPHPRIWRNRKLWLISEIEIALCELPLDRAAEPHGWDEVVNRWSTSDQIEARANGVDEGRFSIATMSNADLHHYASEQHARWREAVLSGAINKREAAALQKLLREPENGLVGDKKVRMGPDTAARLELRGFIKITWKDEARSRIQGYVLLQAGREAAMAAPD